MIMNQPQDFAILALTMLVVLGIARVIICGVARPESRSTNDESAANTEKTNHPAESKSILAIRAACCAVWLLAVIAHSVLVLT